MIRRAGLALLVLAGVGPSRAQTDPAMVPIPLYTAANAPAGVDPLTQFAADTNLRFINGAQARAVLTAQIAALLTRATTLETRAGALESKADLTPRVVALEARAIVPDLTARVTAVEARPTYTTATLTTAGVIRANITQLARTTAPIPVNVSATGILNLPTLLPSVAVPVAGVALGDFVTASFAATPPTGLTIAAAQATAANTVLLTFATTQAVTLTASTQSINFSWMR